MVALHARKRKAIGKQPDSTQYEAVTAKAVFRALM
jgi:hypothetical protein